MNRKLFECYSTRLVEFLLENGLKFKRMDIHKKTNKTMWIFEKDKDLDRLLSIWTNKENLKQQ